MKRETYFSADVTEFLFLLDKHSVQYLIIGGEAAIYYGNARLTGDIDLFYETTAANTKRLFDALREFWNYSIPGIRSQAELMRKGMVFQFGVPPNRIDLITVIEGVDFSSAWQKKETAGLSHKKKKFSIYYIGLDDLILNKKEVGREKDKDDVKYLTAARKRKRAKG